MAHKKCFKKMEVSFWRFSKNKFFRTAVIEGKFSFETGIIVSSSNK